MVGKCKQDFQKLFDSLQDPSVRARQAEEKAADKARIKELEAQLAKDGKAAEEAGPAEVDVDDEITNLRLVIVHYKKIKGLPAGQLAQAEARLEQLYAAKRGAKPVPEQLKKLEEFIQRRQKVVDAAVAKQAQLQVEAKALEESMAEAKKDELDGRAEVIRLEAERAGLLQARAAEAAAAGHVPVISIKALLDLQAELHAALAGGQVQIRGLDRDGFERWAKETEFMVGLAANLKAAVASQPQQQAQLPPPPASAGQGPAQPAAGTTPGDGTTAAVAATVPDTDDDEMGGKTGEAVDVDSLLAEIDYTGTTEEIQGRVRQTMVEALRKKSRHH